MKPILSIIAFAGLFSMTACNSTALQEREAALRIQQHTIDSMNAELAKKKAIDSMSELARVQYMIPPTQAMVPLAQYASQPQQVVVRHTHPSATRRSYTRTSSRSYSGYRQPVVYQQAPVKQRKGWSAKAKGAVIGGAGGAIAGAIINQRNRPVGALIGGILGAGAGTGVGAIIDHKNGR